MEKFGYKLRPFGKSLEPKKRLHDIYFFTPPQPFLGSNVVPKVLTVYEERCYAQTL
jgi:hypothetical protein